jgi:general L-amino acid transport system substrate-binding protein
MSNGNAPGFSENNGSVWSGFDVDFCRVIATAIFGEPSLEIRIADPDPKKRYAAIRNGEVDVMIRNTTWTMTRDASEITGEWAGDKGEGVDFGPIIFNDGQGVMVRKSLNVSTIEELENPTICVLAGTTTEQNLADQFKKRGILYTPMPFAGTSSEAPFAAYDRGECDVVTADRSQLLTRQPTLTNPNDHVILNTWISKEPLAPVVAQNDSQWRDVVSYAVYATMQAEEFKGFGVDVSSKTVEDLLDTTDPDIRRFLGLSGSVGLNLGLDNEFARNIIQQVGNYEEIYTRNLGQVPQDSSSTEKVATPDERGPNKVWNYPEYPGGLLNPPPFR